MAKGKNRDASSIIKDMLSELASHLDQKGAMCTNFVLVSEWVDSEGSYWLATHGEEGIPPWRVEGMLSYALNNVQEDFGDEDEYEDDE